MTHCDEDYIEQGEEMSPAETGILELFNRAEADMTEEERKIALVKFCHATDDLLRRRKCH